MADMPTMFLSASSNRPADRHLQLSPAGAIVSCRG
jgi:hypothetical protein